MTTLPSHRPYNPAGLSFTSASILLFTLISPNFLSCNAFSSSNALENCSTRAPSTPQLLTPESITKISNGSVEIIPNWLPPSLVRSLRDDARSLFADGQFRPDGLTNAALKKSDQGFTSRADRQTFRGGAGWTSDVGNLTARLEFADRMRALRLELAAGLDRPTLAPEGQLKHEMTYNWYEPGAKLGRHLDEHHEETKGVDGWLSPTRRSVTWLVYLNDAWRKEEGGVLRCFPRGEDCLSSAPVGAHEGNLQVGWINRSDPVFLDCFRPSLQAALYRVQKGEANNGSTEDRQYLSAVDFDVPGQPIEFSRFLAPEFQGTFEQISTSRLDPRFAGTAATGATTAVASSNDEKTVLDIVPAAGTLVLFDSVTLPHLVREVTGTRQRIAVTGWFHEESQFVIEI